MIEPLVWDWSYDTWNGTRIAQPLFVSTPTVHWWTVLFSVYLATSSGALLLGIACWIGLYSLLAWLVSTICFSVLLLHNKLFNSTIWLLWGNSKCLSTKCSLTDHHQELNSHHHTLLSSPPQPWPRNRLESTLLHQNSIMWHGQKSGPGGALSLQPKSSHQVQHM